VLILTLTLCQLVLAFASPPPPKRAPAALCKAPAVAETSVGGDGTEVYCVVGDQREGP